MSFEPKTQAFNSSISSVTIGTGDKAVTLGGINVLPFYAFDAPITTAPKIGVEITDHGMAAYPQAGLQEFYAGCQTVADMAKRVETMHGASFICLHFEGADPNGDNRSVEECVEIAKSVADATDLPLVIMGCKNIEKDAELFTKVSEALQGKNILVFSAREENYKSVGASAVMAYGQKVGAESAVDINLAKQLNVLMTQLGVAPTSIVMNAGSAAAGYGYEYVASTLDRIRAAALAETWSVKESMVSEADMPEWGSAEERGIEMEITTAAACLAGGSDAVIMRHPAAIKAISEMIEALV